MRWPLCRPYRIGVFHISAHQLLLICQALLVFLVLLFCVVIGTWSLTAVKSWHLFFNDFKRLGTSAQLVDFRATVLNYGIVVDCGSSGSRVFVYCWPPHSGAPHQLLDIHLLHDSNNNPVVMKIEPGLSSYMDNPSDASDHIVELLKFASVHVPQKMHKETPVYIMATAGLRLLNLRDQEEILNDIRVDVALKFGFLFSPTHVEVISGKQEGIFSWIAINHALGKFGHTLNPDDQMISVAVPGGKKHVRKQTVGILDLGGASLQIAFELPDFEKVDEADKELFAEFNLGCSSSDIDHHYRLYVNTFLGFGSNEARQKYETWILKDSILSVDVFSDDPEIPLIPDVCLPSGRTERILHGNLTALLYGIGNLDECRRRLVALLYNNSAGNSNFMKYAYDTGHRLPINFYESEFYGFSEFFYTTEDILRIGGKYNSFQFRQAAKTYCATNWSLIESWQMSTIFPRANHNRYRLQCFKSAWMMAILHDQLGFPSRYRHLTSVQYIRGEEVHWTLGAILYKTKYYPLRDIEKHRQSQVNSQLEAELTWTSFTNHYYLLLFTTTLVVCILVYRWWCRVFVRPKGLTRVSHVTTMSYFMLDADCELPAQNIRIDRAHSYSHLPYGYSTVS